MPARTLYKPLNPAQGRRIPEGTRRRAAIGIAPIAFVLFLVLAILQFRSVWSTPGTAWLGGCCDPEQAIWDLRWMPYALGHLTDPLFTRHINYPNGVSLMWTNPLPLASFVLAPITLTLGPFVAYNLLVTVDVALSAWCGYLAVRRYSRSVAGALLGGGVYGFSPYVMSQSMQHVNVGFAATPPLLLLLFDEIAIRRRRSPALMGLLLGLLAAAQVLLAEELVATEAIAVVITAIVLAAMYPSEIRPALAYAAEIVPAAIVTFVALAGWPLELQFLGPQRVSGAIWGPSTFVSDLLNFVIPTQAQAIDPAATRPLATHFSGLEHEAMAYVGLPLLLLLGFIAGRWWERPSVRVAAIVGATIAVFSLGPHLVIDGMPTGIVLAWWPMAHLPLMDNILPSRLTIFMYLCVAVLLAAFVDGLTHPPRWPALLPGLLALAVALIPLLPRQPYPVWTTTIPPLFSDWQHSGIRAGTVVLVAPRAQDGAGDNQMLWQAVANDAFRMPDGYFIIPNPKGGFALNALPAAIFTSMDSIQLAGTMPRLTASLRRQIEQDLRARDIGAVLVGPMTNHDLMVQFFTRLFGRAPTQEGGVRVWRDVLRRGVALSLRS